MSRRTFVRLVGGGIVAAALPPLAGCDTRLPPEAVSAWTDPGRHETELRRWMLAHAILAPHAHNLQSWLVDLRTDGEILLRCDLDRLLPQTDPYSRQILMSHGTFLELLDLAARERGHRAEIALFPEGAFPGDRIDGRPVARVRLVPDASVPRDPLFAQIVRRHTNRLAYDPARPVPGAAWTALVAAAGPLDVVVGHVDGTQPDRLARHREIADAAWKVEMTTPRTVLETYKWLRVGGGEIARHRDGVALTDTMPVLLSRLGLFDRTTAPAPDSSTTRRLLDEFTARLASTPGFLWITTRGNARAAQVAAGRAWVRVQLAATAQGLAMQPLEQALQEYPEQAPHYDAIHRLVDAPAPAHTVQMWSRVGFAPPVGPAPRRGLDAQLAKT